MVFIQELAQVTQIRAEFFRRYGRVVPSLPSRRQAWARTGRTRAGLADSPHRWRLAAGIESRVGRRVRALHPFDELARQLIGRSRVVSPELHEQEAAAIWYQL
jgi:hypothetical protein